MIGEASGRGADVVCFPETALTGYFPEIIASASQDELDAGRSIIAAACKCHAISAIVGAPVFTKSTGAHKVGEGNHSVTNSALVFGPDGMLIGEQAKLQLVPTDYWAVPGEKLAVIDIPIGGSSGTDVLKAGVIICHDSRYPELVRLLVLAGARCIFYLSWETWYNDQVSGGTATWTEGGTECI
jgi:predicted amidohydrolase